jgi:glycerol uptake facilitator-like aquaporin
MGVSPGDLGTPPPSPTAGVFSTAQFLGPLIGGITTVIYIWIAILTFGPITGGHLNPFLTIATLFIRITSLPRAVLYVCFQLAGASLAGLMVRAAWGSRDFKVGGCFLFEEQGATVGGALATEFAGCFSTIILAFGVAIDPRNKAVLGPVVAPLLVGLIVGVLVFGLSFAIPGYGGPSMNPGRCFGAYVGSHFPGWHWVHWVGPILASLAHAVMYTAVPPWELRTKVEELGAKPGKEGMSRSGEVAIDARLDRDANGGGPYGQGVQGILPLPTVRKKMSGV